MMRTGVFSVSLFLSLALSSPLFAQLGEVSLSPNGASPGDSGTAEDFLQGLEDTFGVKVRSHLASAQAQFTFDLDFPQDLGNLLVSLRIEDSQFLPSGLGSMDGAGLQVVLVDSQSALPEVAAAFQALEGGALTLRLLTPGLLQFSAVSLDAGSIGFTLNAAGVMGQLQSSFYSTNQMPVLGNGSGNGMQTQNVGPHQEWGNALFRCPLDGTEYSESQLQPLFGSLPMNEWTCPVHGDGLCPGQTLSDGSKTLVDGIPAGPNQFCCQPLSLPQPPSIAVGTLDLGPAATTPSAIPFLAGWSSASSGKGVLSPSVPTPHSTGTVRLEASAKRDFGPGESGESPRFAPPVESFPAEASWVDPLSKSATPAAATTASRASIPNSASTPTEAIAKGAGKSPMEVLAPMSPTQEEPSSFPAEALIAGLLGTSFLLFLGRTKPVAAIRSKRALQGAMVRPLAIKRIPSRVLAKPQTRIDWSRYRHLITDIVEDASAAWTGWARPGFSRPEAPPVHVNRIAKKENRKALVS